MIRPPSHGGDLSSARPSATTPVRAASALARLSGAPPRRRLDGLLVSGVTHDSRAVLPGDLYVGLPAGMSRRRLRGPGRGRRGGGDGERPPERSPATFVVDESRAVLGELAAHVYGHPSHTVQVIGVTGTNGKTTTTYFLDAGLRAAGHPPRSSGRSETRVGDRRLRARTPRPRLRPSRHSSR